MYLKQIPNKSTGRICLAIYESKRNKETKKNTSYLVRNLGYLDDLEKEHPDPVAWGKQIALEMTEEKNAYNAEFTVTLAMNEKLDAISFEDTQTILRKNIGYLVLSWIYHEFEIDCFWNNRRRYTKARYNQNSIFKMLVYDRILNPGSKKAAWERRGMYLDDGSYSLEDVYRSLDFFLKYRTQLLQHINFLMGKRHQRDTTLLFYDVTNYYFEIDGQDRTIDEDGEIEYLGLRQKGYSKENRKSPIVQMGLFMDENGIPVSYELFRGNMNDCNTYPVMLDETFSKFDNMEGIITVADKGMMTADNIREIHIRNQGYVLSYSVRKAKKEFVDYVLEEDGYNEIYDKDSGELLFKYKSRFFPRKIAVSSNSSDSNTKAVAVNERQIILWSRKYAERERSSRGKVLEKARKLIGRHSDDAKEISFGARKYMMKVAYSKKNGEILGDIDYLVDLDSDAINEDEALDGYYAICTNVVGIPEEGEGIPFKPFRKGEKARYNHRDGFFELNRRVSDLDILDMYKGLWKIEETFRVTKTDLEARPVNVSTDSHIRAHFLTCFVSLFILRFIQYKMDWSLSASRIKEALRNASGSLINGNMYVFDYFTEDLKTIGNCFGLDFSRKYRTLGEIRSMLGETKKNIK